MQINNAISNQSFDLANKTYILLPLDEDVDKNSLQNTEYLTYITHALASKGAIEADASQTPNLAIFYGYGIGDPEQLQANYAIPVRGVTKVVTTQGAGRRTTSTPKYGTIGYQTGTRTDITYTRHIILDAIDYSHYLNTGETKQVWKVTVTSTGSSDDLRRVFPYMVQSSIAYLGENTGEKVSVSLSEGNKSVQNLRQKVVEPK